MGKKNPQNPCFEYTQERLFRSDSIQEIKTELRMNVEPQFLPLHTAFTTQPFTSYLYFFFSHRTPASTGQDGIQCRQWCDTCFSNGSSKSLLTAGKQKWAELQHAGSGAGRPFRPTNPTRDAPIPPLPTAAWALQPCQPTSTRGHCPSLRLLRQLLPIHTLTSPTLVTCSSISLPQPTQSPPQVARSWHCSPVPPHWWAGIWWIRLSTSAPCWLPDPLNLFYSWPSRSTNSSILPRLFAWSPSPRPQIKISLRDKKSVTLGKVRQPKTMLPPHVTMKTKSSISLVLFVCMALVWTVWLQRSRWARDEGKILLSAQQGRNRVLSGGRPYRERQQGQPIRNKN